MKNIINCFLKVNLGFIFVISSNLSNVSALDYTNDQDTIFPKEEVNELITKANNLEINRDDKLKTRTATGTYPTRKGVILVTDDAYKGVIKTGHSSIIYTSSTVVEANEPGVEIGPNNWNTSKNQAYAVTVKDTTSKQDVSAADYCYSQLGKPYNWNFYRMDYGDKFYCSQLIRSAYLDLYDIDLNTGDFDILTGKAIHPMELVNTSKTKLIYRKK